MGIKIPRTLNLFSHPVAIKSLQHTFMCRFSFLRSGSKVKQIINNCLKISALGASYASSNSHFLNCAMFLEIWLCGDNHQNSSGCSSPS